MTPYASYIACKIKGAGVPYGGYGGLSIARLSLGKWQRIARSEDLLTPGEKRKATRLVSDRC